MDVVTGLHKVTDAETVSRGEYSAKGVDHMALNVTKELLAQKTANDVAMWEHEDLAKVRIKVFRAHTGEVNKCQFVCNETRILSCSTDGSIKMWDAQLGAVMQSYDDAHDINVSEVFGLEDGSKMISCGWDKQVTVWDTQTGKQLWIKKHFDMLTCCHLSHDGRTACVGSDLFREMYIYDLLSGDVVMNIREFHESSLTSIQFTPDDTRVITTSTDCTAKFYDVRSDTCTIKLEGHANTVSGSAITPDERKFATSSWDKTINIWDVATGMYRSQGPTTLKGCHDGSVLACDFTDDGQQLVSGSADLSIVVWDVENGTKKLKLQGHGGWVTDVHFSNDHNWLLSCSKDSTIRMWNIEDCDKIPLVIEQKKQAGFKVNTCSNCQKPFLMAEAQDFKNHPVCVFCRMQSPEQSWLTFNDDLDI